VTISLTPTKCHPNPTVAFCTVDGKKGGKAPALKPRALVIQSPGNPRRWNPNSTPDAVVGRLSRRQRCPPAPVRAIHHPPRQPAELPASAARRPVNPARLGAVAWKTASLVPPAPRRRPPPSSAASQLPRRRASRDFRGWLPSNGGRGGAAQRIY
jgi:hypothetical protein